MARVAAGRTLERPRRRLRVTTLVRAPPSGVRVRAVHAENGGIRRRNLQMAAGVPWADGAPTRHAQRRRPYPARFRSVMVQGTPGSPWYRPTVPLVAVSGGFNCPQAPQGGRVRQSSLGLIRRNSEPGLRGFYSVGLRAEHSRLGVTRIMLIITQHILSTYSIYFSMS